MENTIETINGNIVENDVIKTKKRSHKSFFKKVWLVILAMFLLTTVVCAVGWSNYRKVQKTTVDLSNASLKIAGVSKTYTYSADSVNNLYDYYNPEYYSVKIGNKYINNSNVVDSSEKADEALADLLESLGHEVPSIHGSYYLKYTNYMDYSAELHPVLFGVSALLMPIALILHLISFFMSRGSLVVEGDKVVCYKGKKAKKEFMLRDVKSVSATKFAGLKLLGNGVKWKEYFVSDCENIKNSLMEKIQSVSKENQQLQPATATPASAADELKKYKDLLDSGAITQEEYDTKKKQILGF